MPAIISKIIPHSLAEKAGLRCGDEIKFINNKQVIDYLDYMFLSTNEDIYITLSDNRCFHISNPDYEPLGIEFETLLIDKPKSCLNKCVFCFIDQLPPNMRESCYFKDDDYRLSFLQGNYVTLTNMSDSDLDRIISYSLPRINISVHTTNPELRRKMLHNKNAGKIMEQIHRLAAGGLSMNCQIVLCPGYNDKDELDRTISDLGKFCGYIESVSVVPVGLSDFRENLALITSFDCESSNEVIDRIEKWQSFFYKKTGTNFVYLSDEFYINANRPIPKSEHYDGFPQIENGVGLCASLRDEFMAALAECKSKEVKTEKSIATGVIAFDFIKSLTEKLDGKPIHVYKINNEFFGEKITVTGLITGGDLIKQLKGKKLGEKLVLSKSMLRHNEYVFLDNVTLKDVERELNIEIALNENDGYQLLDRLLE